jgi:hypothetical protein
MKGWAGKGQEMELRDPPQDDASSSFAWEICFLVEMRRCHQSLWKIDFGHIFKPSFSLRSCSWRQRRFIAG